MSIVPGSIIAHYEVLNRLGGGGMGDVYRARDRRLERFVAVKTLPPAYSDDPDRLARFISEAKILASLNHPNIGAIYGMEELPSGEKCLILELIEGMSLAEKLGREKLLVEDTLKICAGIAGALKAAHDKGIIHRDLKPGNVMITEHGEIKVLDFGLARKVSRYSNGPENSDIDATRLLKISEEINQIEGTPGYMSPEQIRGETQDQRADIFAFGCILYECLAGRRAFKGNTPLETMACVLTFEPPWSALPANTPRAVLDLLLHCLNKDTADRLENIISAERILTTVERTGSDIVPGAPMIPNNLPGEISNFIGREAELAQCRKFMKESRLLTLTGIGGSGKTRLALRLARDILDDYPDGVYFADLAPLTNPERVVLTVASALNVQEETNRALLETLTLFLADRQILLILDNCEHLLDASSKLVKAILESCRNVKLITTSRENLGLKGEQLFLMQPLSLPPDGAAYNMENILTSEAVRLFVDRARSVNSKFELDDSNSPDVAEICSRLDGIPLAIELAAIRVKMLTVDQIRDKLSDRFRLLMDKTSSTIPRHQTLAAAIQWSYDHLLPEEQRLFESLSIFSGGWTLSAAIAVSGDGKDEFSMLDALTRLADKSLILADRRSSQGTRYTMLETVRQYALEHLKKKGKEADARGRHFSYYLSFAQDISRHVFGPEKKRQWELLDHDLENILSAHAWCNRSDERARDGLRLVYALRNYWLPSGFSELGLRVTIEALNRPGAAVRTQERAKVLLTAGAMAYFTGRLNESEKYLYENLQIMRESSEKGEISSALTGLAVVAVAQKRITPALDLLNEAILLARQAKDRPALANALNAVGEAYRYDDKFEEATEAYEEAVKEFDEAGNFDDGTVARCNLVRVFISRGNLPRSREISMDIVNLTNKIGSKHVWGHILDAAAGLAMAHDEWEFGTKIYGAAENLLEQSGIRRDITDQKFIDPLVSRTLASLGEQLFEEFCRQGSETAIEDITEHISMWLKSFDSK